MAEGGSGNPMRGSLRRRARAESGLPGDRESMLPQSGVETVASGAGLQFPGKFTPHIENVQDRAVAAKQGSMNTLQSGDAHPKDAFRVQVRNGGKFFLHAFTTMNAPIPEDSKWKNAASGEGAATPP